jgi:hypothetical protein
MIQEKEKHFTKKTSIQLIFLLVTLFLVVILFTQCSTKQPPLKQPPVKVNRPEPPKPTPPPLPPPAPKKAKYKASEDSIVMGFPCGIEGGVEEGIDFGVEGGAADGVLGAPPVLGKGAPAANMNMKACGTTYFMSEPSHTFNTEEYSRIYESRFLETLDNPLSTFSIDVDTGAYANVRRFLNHSQLPPEDAVRIEEMINYFEYDYPRSMGRHPFSVNTRLAACPWNTSAQLLHIGIRGKSLESEKIPPSNLVFLLDVSGSMRPSNKLPLLVSSFKLLVKELTAKDKVAIVVYAGAAGLVLPSTPGDQKDKILGVLDMLRAGGSTAGGAGIKLAYKIAEENFIQKGGGTPNLFTVSQMPFFPGHTVTALYEIIPTDPEKTVPGSASLRFQETRVKPEAFKTDEIALVKLRYKQPRGTVSQLITHPVNREKQENNKGSNNLRFSAAVAMFGMLLRDSEYAGNATYDNVLSFAKSASEKDKYGYRSEFLRLVSIAKELKK